MFSKQKTIFLKEKLCSLFKKDPHYANESTENQKNNEQADNPINTKKIQLSTNHWFLTNQTHSDSEIRENGFANKSQETKVKTKMTRKAMKS
jgi:hypothetical protein